jgi:carboxymethylenebutenolidase
MGQHINLNTSGTQCIGAYLAKPEGKPRGGIVVVQEIFGVNAHIRSVADGFAAAGYSAIAPAFFDHVETGVELRYDPADYKQGMALAGEVGFDRAIGDVASAAESIRSAGKIGVVGYCWGGTVAFLAAIRLGLPSVSYYGGRNNLFLGEPLQAPVQFHYGAQDSSSPPETVQKLRDALNGAPHEVEIYTYPTGHAFNRDIDPTHYHADSARLARERTLAFFGRHLG